MFNTVADTVTQSSSHEALKTTSDIAAHMRPGLLPAFENRNLKQHLHFPSTETHGSVYYEFHRGARDDRQTKENRERSLLYKERLRSHNHDLGKDNDPDLHRYSVKKKAYKAHQGVRQQYQD